jgi:hypothetical protein
MRWSLIISISATLLGLFAFSAYGLVIPVDADDGLVLRAVTKKARKPSAPRAKNPLTQGSAKDRKESYKHRHSYAVQKDKNGMKKWQAGKCCAILNERKSHFVLFSRSHSREADGPRSLEAERLKVWVSADCPSSLTTYS